ASARAKNTRSAEYPANCLLGKAALVRGMAASFILRDEISARAALYRSECSRLERWIERQKARNSAFLGAPFCRSSVSRA
ncbi:MAG: hypothetical protein ABJH34_02820, partial [Qipengyuania citrea]|uniref:hypothetical protein n=1 Tax=Qipengyuania citrea TaxID=225971 RepID=UPI00329958F7